MTTWHARDSKQQQSRPMESCCSSITISPSPSSVRLGDDLWDIRHFRSPNPNEAFTSSSYGADVTMSRRSSCELSFTRLGPCARSGGMF